MIYEKLMLSDERLNNRETGWPGEYESSRWADRKKNPEANNKLATEIYYYSSAALVDG